MSIQTAPAKSAFLITIDTEGDNLWGCGQNIETRNARFLPRFQTLCERYGFKPSYLVNYEMAMDCAFIEFGRDLLMRDAGEVGMHLHAWNSPPLSSAYSTGLNHRPYLIEYPEQIMAEKIEYMTDLLRKTFDTSIVSHRSGRWAFNETYAKLLVKNGYCVDCSVTPWVSWRDSPGMAGGAGGTDYSSFPEHSYRINLADISCKGLSPLIELPMTIRPSLLQRWMPKVMTSGVSGRIVRGLGGAPVWMRPNGSNLGELEQLAQSVARKGDAYLQFMLHSSELMPGGSPTFPDSSSIEKLYVQLEQLFVLIATMYKGETLKEHAARIQGQLQ